VEAPGGRYSSFVRIQAAQRSVASQLALSALLFAVVFAGLADGIVLCFGGDGHVAIEAAGVEGCVEAAEAAAPGVSLVALSLSSSHCGPCVDVALSSSSPIEGIQAEKRIDPAAAIPTTQLRPQVPHLRASVSYRHFSPHASERAHSVVIRC
jgi:hypothetical protein